MIGTLEGQKRVLGFLKLQLQMHVSCHVAAGNRTWVLCKSSVCSQVPSHLSITILKLIYNYFEILVLCIR